MTRSVVLAGVTALAAVTLVACAPGIDAQKHASLRRNDTRGVAAIATPDFVSSHSAVLLTGADEVDRLDISERGVRGTFRLHGATCRTIGGCTAVPIDSRGYWLTAAHCVDSGGVLICDLSRDGDHRGIPARIVWVGTAPGHDLALLYSPLPDGILPVTAATGVRMGEEILCVGSGLRSDRLSAGHVVGVGGSTDSSLTWLEHDAPLSAGDSGGPAFYRDGELAGINFEAGQSLSGKRVRATAIQPDMEQLRARIDADWASRPEPR